MPQLLPNLGQKSAAASVPMESDSAPSDNYEDDNYDDDGDEAEAEVKVNPVIEDLNLMVALPLDNNYPEPLKKQSVATTVEKTKAPLENSIPPRSKPVSVHMSRGPTPVPSE